MRTPLTSSILFLNLLKSIFPDLDNQKLAIKYFKLIFSQLMLVQTFVDDLLDLRQLKEGVLVIAYEAFDPNDLLELVFQVFLPQAEAQKTQLSWRVVEQLRLPERKS